MKINSKILSIPPYISTPWKYVSTLLMKETALVINLIDGKTIEIPNLETAFINTIFEAHGAFLEQMSQAIPLPLPPFMQNLPSPLLNKQQLGIPFKFGVGMGNLDEMGSSVFQHNSAQGDTPDIPAEILEKIVTITKIVAPDETVAFPKPEPHCNCVHCQVGRAMNGMSKEEAGCSKNSAVQEVKEETITVEDLHFQDWDILPTSNQLFSVVSRLDPNEKYTVFLGNPIGCTCGKTGCEHIIAVLKS